MSKFCSGIICIGYCYTCGASVFAHRVGDRECPSSEVLNENRWTRLDIPDLEDVFFEFLRVQAYIKFKEV